jgi:hypothetical protein
MTGATINATLAFAAVLILAVYGAGIWAITRIRTHRAAYRHGHNAGRVIGHVAGYRKAYAEQEILVDDLREEIDHLEQRMAELSRQQRRAA